MNAGQFTQRWTHHTKDKYIRKTYKAWNDMNARCYLPTATGYANYGGRGITVCDQWRKDFDCFVRDMGIAPVGLTLERIEVNAGYDPFNCIWATRKEQANNTTKNIRISYAGETRTLTQWAEHLGLSATRLHSRMRLGWKFEAAINPEKYKAPHGSHQCYQTGCRCVPCIEGRKKRASDAYRKKNPVIKNRSKNFPNKDRTMIPKFPKKPTTPIKPKSQSSNVAGFTHNPQDNTLDVTFHGGRVYRYKGVNTDQHAALTASESKGEFLNTEIIPHHTFSRLR